LVNHCLGQPVNGLVNHSNGGLVGLLIGWSDGRSVCLSVVRVVVYFAWSGGRWFGRLIGWLVVWLLGSLEFQPRRDHEGKKPSNHFTGGWVGPKSCLDWVRKSTACTMIQSPNQPGHSESLYPRHEAGAIEVHLHTTFSIRRISVVNTLPPN